MARREVFGHDDRHRLALVQASADAIGALEFLGPERTRVEPIAPGLVEQPGAAAIFDGDPVRVGQVEDVILLAEAGVSIVPICAYRKDHLLVRESQLATAVQVLQELAAGSR